MTFDTKCFTNPLRNADELLLEMKSYIDSLLANDSKLHRSLQWLNQKSSSIETDYKPAAIRGFYLALDLSPTFALNRILYIGLAAAIDKALNLGLNLNQDCTLYLDQTLNGSLSIALYRNDFYEVLSSAIAFAHDPKLKLQLQQLEDRIPKSDDEAKYREWWNTNGKQWAADLRQIMITHRNIGHDWQFTDKQKQLLQQYYDANLLLVQCLNSDDCYVSRHVRESIENTLLLPRSEC